MTLEERKAMIDQKIKRDEEATIAAEEQYEREYEEKLATIKSLTPRIKDLIEFTNYAIDNGINLSKSGWGGHEGYDTGMFVSNGWSHVVGLMGDNYLGIRKGGACGCIDFYTDGENTYGYDTSKRRVVTPLLSDMKHFLAKFNELEKELYEYVEKKCKE